MDTLEKIEATLKEIITETEFSIGYFKGRLEQVKTDDEKKRISKIIASLETLLSKLKEN